MKLTDVSIPQVYLTSSDFKFFRDWFAHALTKVHYDTEHFIDLYDPLKCPEELLWLLADTMGFKFDDRLPTAFNRLVLIYFMDMIRNRGSRDGVALAAEVNLTQFPLVSYGAEHEILYNRLEDTSIPVNSVYVQPHTAEGYIEIVYFSTQRPVDACVEYVRPLGMYCFQHAGVRYDGRTRLSIDARLTDTRELGESIGPTHIAHYSREDYARAQKQRPASIEADPAHTRRPVYYRNSVYEELNPDQRPSINPGLRSLYSLQLCNNEHVVKSLIQPIFGLGMTPGQRVPTFPDEYVIPEFEDGVMPYNLRYDRVVEENITHDVYTAEQGSTPTNPIPKVNPPMFSLGEAIALDADNEHFTKKDAQGNIVVD